MIRHCNGEDINLIMPVSPQTGERVEPSKEVDRHAITVIMKPCTCGRVFDDVYRSTVYPHTELL